MNKVTNENARKDMVRQAREGGAVVDDDASVYMISEEFCGIFAVEDENDFVFLENGAGLFVPDDRDELIEQLAQLD
jgi:hypothetical protein